jgi:hypothetical protein
MAKKTASLVLEAPQYVQLDVSVTFFGVLRCSLLGPFMTSDALFFMARARGLAAIGGCR